MIRFKRGFEVVLISGALGGLPLRVAAEEAGIDAISAAMKFANLMSAGDYVEAHQLLNPLMTRGLRPIDLDLSWHTQAFSYGRFRSFGEASQSQSASDAIVEIPVKWERGERTLTVVIGRNGTVDGFSWGWEDPEKKPGMPVPDPLLKEIRVAVGEAPWKVAGILTMPANGSPRAGVVFVQDTGQNDADLTYRMPKPYRDLAAGLGQLGIASLRYDQRTLKHAAKIDFDKLKVREEIVEDALAAWKVMREREELKDRPLYLLGFGRGGTLLPEIAGSLEGVAGIILLSAVSRPTEEALTDQMEYLSGLVADEELKQGFASALDRLAELKKRSLAPEDMLFDLTASYWYDLMDRDAEVAIGRAASFPGRILVVQGGRDFEVTDEDFRGWQNGLSKHADATFKMFEDLNHVFAKGQDKSNPEEYTIPKEFSRQAITFIAEWILRPVGKTAEKSP